MLVAPLLAQGSRHSFVPKAPGSFCQLHAGRRMRGGIKTCLTWKAIYTRRNPAKLSTVPELLQTLVFAGCRGFQSLSMYQISNSVLENIDGL